MLSARPTSRADPGHQASVRPKAETEKLRRMNVIRSYESLAESGTRTASYSKFGAYEPVQTRITSRPVIAS